MGKWLKQILQRYKDRRYRKYTRMSVQEVFSGIYKKNVWGGENGEFYSGEGTSDTRNRYYIQAVKDFISANNVQSIVEIGCGDFRIMQELMADISDINYIGLDIVPALIKRNNKLFNSNFISFSVADAIVDDLPDGDLVIIRQVLQHLQNDQIHAILNKIRKFRYALITEHVAIMPGVQPNLDKVVGPHIRTRVNSGVFIDKPPFSIPHTSVVLEYGFDEKVKKKIIPAVIRTYLVKNELV